MAHNLNLVKRKKDIALDSLHGIASCFDRLFGHISPVISPISSSTLINETNLSPSSIEWIQHISRGLINVITLINEIEEESPLIIDEIKLLKEKLLLEEKRSNLLQDFLINELTNSETLSSEMRSLKETLSITLKQRDNYKEKCDSQIEELRMLARKSNQNHQSVNSGNDATEILSQSLLGKYIKKVFKGYGVFYAVVIGYLKPYYKVILF